MCGSESYCAPPVPEVVDAFWLANGYRLFDSEGKADRLVSVLCDLLLVRPDLVCEVLAAVRSRNLHPAGFMSKSDFAHLTCSTVVVNRDGKVLLTLHARHRTWQQLGGHPESEADPRDTALREAKEESGIDALELFPVPIDLDVHDVDCPRGSSNTHYDLCFVATTSSKDIVKSSESQALRWTTSDELAALQVKRRVKYLVDVAVRISGNAENAEGGK